MGQSRSRVPRHRSGGEAAPGHPLPTIDDDPATLEPGSAATTDVRPAGLPVGLESIRVFRAARRRRLAMPVDQRPRLSPGLVAELEARGWDIPPELRPEPDTGNGYAEHDQSANEVLARSKAAS